MEGIPPAVAAVLRPVLPDLAAETIRAIGREVPDYSRPLEGRLGVTLRYGTERALGRFVDSIEAPAAVSDRDRRIYFELGRLEMREGRTLNALLAAYRVGAQIAWRRFVEAGVRAGLDPPVLYRLGEAIFAYIDEISGESIEGYAAEQSAAAGERQRRRAQLVFLLAAQPPAAAEDVRSAAVRAAWRPPALVAALVAEGIDSERLASRLGPGAVAAPLENPAGPSAPRRAARVLAFVADPSAPARRAQLEQAVAGLAAALGPAVALAGAARSAERARRALDAARRRAAAGRRARDRRGPCRRARAAGGRRAGERVRGGAARAARRAAPRRARPADGEPGRLAGLPGPRRRDGARARHPPADRALPPQPAPRGVRRRAGRSRRALRARARAAGARGARRRTP